MKSFRIKITSFIVIALIVSLGGMSLLNYCETRRLLTNDLEESIASLTQSSASEVGLWLSARKAEMEMMAGMPLIQSGDKDAIIGYLNAEKDRNNIYEQFFIADTAGNYFLNTGQTGTVADRNYFQKVMATGVTVISDPLISRGSGNQIVVVAAPLKKNGKVTGLIGGNVNLAELAEIVASRKAGQIGYAFMVQEDGLVITHPDRNLVMKYNALLDSEDPGLKEAVRKMTGGETGVSRYVFLGRDKYMAFAPVPGMSWSLAVTVPVTYVTNQLYHLPVYHLTVMLFFGSLLALLLSRWLVAPLSRLAKITTGMTAGLNGQADVNWPETPVIEVDSLMINFRNMAAALKEKFQEIKEAKEKLEIEIAERKHAEEHLKQSFEKLGATYEELGATYEELEATEEELRSNYKELQRKEEALRESEELFRTMSERAPIGIYILQDGVFQFVNPQFQQYTGYHEDELLGINSMRLVAPEDMEKVRASAIEMLKGKNRFPYEYRAVKKNGETVWVMETVAPIKYKGGRATLGNYMDISERKRAEIAVRESESKFRTLFEEALNPIFVFDENGRCLDANKAGLDFLECPKEELTSQFVNSLQQPDDQWNSCFGPGTLELNYVVNGNHKIILLNIAAVNVSGKKTFYGIGQDITGRKRMEEKFKHLSIHDPLTGLYNRTYFDEMMRRLEEDCSVPVGIMVCDVDGLKLVNDTLGHSKGDELLRLTAGIIRKCFRKEDTVCRIGGDEFAVILPGSGLNAVEPAYRRLQGAVANYNLENPEVPLSLSAGFAVSGENYINLSDVFREADNNMYREKLHRNRSTRSAIVQALMKALEARDYITEGHAERLQSLVAAMGEAIGLPERNITDLRLLAQFHDIGKVGVPDRILFKAGPLSREEYSEMKRHSEIGHRIAQSAPDLAPVADWILKHHEWWNGEGYPLGLKGEEIPLECRILAIADAYDAMTSDRPYRKAMSHEEAVKELTRRSGTQFDPGLVPVALAILNSRRSTGPLK